MGITMKLWKLTAITTLVISGSAMAEYQDSSLVTAPLTFDSNLIATALEAKNASSASTYNTNLGTLSGVTGNGNEHVTIVQQGTGNIFSPSTRNFASATQNNARESSTLIYQQGKGNTVDTTQSATNSLIYISQNGGPGNTIGDDDNKFTQSGDHNIFVVKQLDDNNKVHDSHQSGSHNKVIVYQQGDNNASIESNGDYNNVFVSQSGSANNADVKQIGSHSSHNTAYVYQTVTSNTGNITQTNGAGNTALIRQDSSYGHNTANVTQTGGVGNFASVKQGTEGNHGYGDASHDSATITQNGGIGNIALTQQSDWYGHINVSQDQGTGNFVKVNQNSVSADGGLIGSSVAVVKQYHSVGGVVDIDQYTRPGVSTVAATAYVSQSGFGNTAKITQN